ncbi:hypothetical protein PSHT_14153 [Puccinia striiformis]|uniref:Uncharacterized protein n=1 Tax=Puccinia striiformis TaxID=27350 RepID=A0A2S4ULN7_9BASI|nr:hypothetical protein PSHT_14153 [Puccinia striiformis]
MLWFLQEVFNPKYGIPILGRTYMRKLINANFGPVQIWLLNLLQEDNPFTQHLSQSQQFGSRKPYHSNGKEYIHMMIVEELQEVMLSELNQAMGNFKNYPTKPDPKIGTPLKYSYQGIGDFRITFNSWGFPVGKIHAARSVASK